ncbi:hypothetical protein L218DRAFT_942633 [Marasmius fiardii PR-910]|nr:hypothetical protein L218DRAFT_942633 [Marasmius fiardii PR-910]
MTDPNCYRRFSHWWLIRVVQKIKTNDTDKIEESPAFINDRTHRKSQNSKPGQLERLLKILGRPVKVFLRKEPIIVASEPKKPTGLARIAGKRVARFTLAPLGRERSGMAKTTQTHPTGRIHGRLTTGAGRTVGRELKSKNRRGRGGGIVSHGKSAHPAKILLKIKHMDLSIQKRDTNGSDEMR